MGAQKIQPEDWNTSASDALRVSILSGDVNSGRDVERWNLDQHIAERSETASANRYAKKVDYDYYMHEAVVKSETPKIKAKVEPLFRADASKYADDFLNTETESPCVSEQLNDIAIGIYTASTDYFEMIENEFGLCHPNVKLIRIIHEDSNISKLAGLIVHLSDDDEDALLDEMLDKSSEMDSLYLSEENLSKNCIATLNEFIHTL